MLVRFDEVSLSYGLKPLLDKVTLQLAKGERLCLLGRNGEGKSSLMRLVTRQILPDQGEVWVRPGARVALLDQDVAPDSAARVQEVVTAGIAHDQMDGDWQAQLDAQQIMARLELDPDARMSDLSGGWRRRALLGRALVSSPDVLLLDEPTNHLDIEAIDWLETLMLEFGGALLFISHDRAFVRRLASRIIELDRGILRDFPCSYDEYRVRKAQLLDAEAKGAALFDKKLAQEEAWIRQGVEARRTRNEGRVRALKQMRVAHRARRERIGQVDLKAQDATPSGKLVFEMSAVTMAFDGRPPLIRSLDLRVMRGDRIGIIGPNGSGKSTLIKLLVGELEPTAGTVRRGTQLKVAYFDQQRDQLDLNASIMDNVTGGGGDTVVINGSARHVSGYLRDFLFPAERLQAPVSMLSGGERNRLLLARLFAQPSNVLVMDEPTNDLDGDTLELLEEMVSEYPGTLLLVSHDREFLDNVVTSTLVFEGDGQLEDYVGGYSDWLAHARQKKSSRSGRRGQEKGKADAPKMPKARKLSFNEQRELASLPQTIQALEAEEAQLQALVSDPAFFRSEAARAAASLQRLADLPALLQAAYARWTALETDAGS